MKRAYELAEQRKHRRAHLRLPVRIRWQGPLGMRFEIAEIIDVAREGVLLACEDDLVETMSRAWIVFPFDASAEGAVEPETPARIVRVEGDPAGVHRVGLQLQPSKRSVPPMIHPDRRGCARIAVCLPIFVRSEGTPWPEETMTRDFSPCGLRFETSHIYTTGESIRAKIPWGEWAEAGELFGRVVRVESGEEETTAANDPLADHSRGRSGADTSFNSVAVEWTDKDLRTT